MDGWFYADEEHRRLGGWVVEWMTDASNEAHTHNRARATATAIHPGRQGMNSTASGLLLLEFHAAEWLSTIRSRLICLFTALHERILVTCKLGELCLMVALLNGGGGGWCGDCVSTRKIIPSQPPPPPPFQKMTSIRFIVGKCWTLPKRGDLNLAEEPKGRMNKMQ